MYFGPYCNCASALWFHNETFYRVIAIYYLLLCSAIVYTIKLINRYISIFQSQFLHKIISLSYIIYFSPGTPVKLKRSTCTCISVPKYKLISSTCSFDTLLFCDFVAVTCLSPLLDSLQLHHMLHVSSDRKSKALQP